MATITPTHRIVPCPAAERGQNLHLGYDAKNKDKICFPSRAGVVVRSLSDPKDSDIFTGFRGLSNTTVAKFSPSGYYIAAGSTGGWVKIFASKRNEEGDYILKAEYEVLSGPPKDLAWDGESKRICVVGDGKDSFSRAFIVDSGATTGDLGGHSGRGLSVDYKPSRPFRVVTGAEDAKSNFYAGPPFKFGHSNECHTNNVTCVRYNHKGTFYATVGSDKQGFIYEGKAGQQVGVIGPEGMHKGTVYTCCWSPDDTMILTTSADKTAKLWQVAEDQSAATLMHTYDFLDSKNILNMVCGGIWTDSGIVMCTLNGDVLQVPLPGGGGAEPEPEPAGGGAAAGGAVSKAYVGHNSYISGLGRNPESGQVLAVDGGGRAIAWDIGEAMGQECYPPAGKAPKIFTCCATSTGAPIAFCGTGDNKVMVTNLATGTVEPDPLSISKVARAVAASPLDPNVAYVISSEQLLVVAHAGGKLSTVASYPIDEPTVLATTPCGGFLLVGTQSGGARGGGKLTLYPCTASSVEVGAGVELESPHGAEITAVAFAADGATFATADKRSAGGNIAVWDRDEGAATLRCEGWVYHQAAVKDLAFSPDGKWLTSVAGDSSMILFGIDGSSPPAVKTQYPNLHEDGITTVMWLDDSTIVTGGQDGQLRTYSFSPPSA